jgi:hypothetical protein
MDQSFNFDHEYFNWFNGKFVCYSLGPGCKDTTIVNTITNKIMKPDKNFNPCACYFYGDDIIFDYFSMTRRNLDTGEIVTFEMTPRHRWFGLEMTRSYLDKRQLVTDQLLSALVVTDELKRLYLKTKLEHFVEHQEYFLHKWDLSNIYAILNQYDSTPTLLGENFARYHPELFPGVTTHEICSCCSCFPDVKIDPSVLRGRLIWKKNTSPVENDYFKVPNEFTDELDVTYTGKQIWTHHHREQEIFERWQTDFLKQINDTKYSIVSLERGYHIKVYFLYDFIEMKPIVQIDTRNFTEHSNVIDDVNVHLPINNVAGLNMDILVDILPDLML